MIVDRGRLVADAALDELDRPLEDALPGAGRVKAELRKLRTIPTVAGLARAMLALVVFAVLLHGLSLPAASVSGGGAQLKIVFGWGELFGALFGGAARRAVDDRRVPARDDPAGALARSAALGASCARRPWRRWGWAQGSGWWRRASARASGRRHCRLAASRSACRPGSSRGWLWAP